MQNIIVMGAGKIGSLITYLLQSCGSYHIYLADINQPKLQYTDTSNITIVQLDADNPTEIASFIKQQHVTAIISSLPYYCNLTIAKVAHQTGIAYFDLTEDVATKEGIIQLAKGRQEAYVPQCGLAPGFIDIVANDLIQSFSNIESVKLRVGALPQNADNALHYALTWSTEGLINEYGNPCQAIENGEIVQAEPLEDLEELIIDGVTYEAFNTSGGAGSLVESYAGKVKQLNYKTIRYKGHCDKIKFLMNDLKLNQERDVLQHIIETAIPTTTQDIVIVYAAVTGLQKGKLTETQFAKKYYPRTEGSLTWSAIQLTTASSLCAVFDIVMQNSKHYHGFIKQEDFTLQALLDNRLGQYFGEQHE